MNNANTLLRNEPVAKYGDTAGSNENAKVGIEPDRSGAYEIALNGNGFTLLLAASLSSSNLSLHDTGIHWKGENAPMISAGIDFQKASLNKKRIISAKEAGRLVLLDLERAEAKRRQYADELARFQTEREEPEEKAALNKKRIISAKEAGRLALLNLEKAEARRRKYVEDLARIQPDFKE